LLGTPRIGTHRELKLALESFVIPSNDFLLYDQVLDTSVMINHVDAMTPCGPIAKYQRGFGSRSDFTCVQASGIETGAPVRARGDNGATAVAMRSLRAQFLRHIHAAMAMRGSKEPLMA
jgi:Cobalamin-independent synthase, N-terminal domain